MKKTAVVMALAAGAALAGGAHADESKTEVRVRVVEELPCSTAKWQGDDSLGLKVTKRGFLGVEITSLTPDLRRHFGVNEDEGVMIGKVVDDSAAFRAGLEVGDIVTRVDGRTIEGSWDLTSAIRESATGETVSIEFWRDGTVNQLAVTLDERETCTFDMSSVASSLEELQDVLPGLHMRGLEIGEEAMEEVMDSLRDINWEEHLQELEEVHVKGFGVRMEELEERMEELGEHLERESERIHVRRMRVVEEADRQRIEHEIEVRTELSRARAEARRETLEARREGVEARRSAVEAARVEDESRVRASADAKAVIEEAERAQAEEARAREEGGNGFI